MSDMKPQGIQHPSYPESDYERDDANVSAILNSMGIVITSTLVVMAAMYGMFNFLNHYYDKSESRYAALSSYSRIPGPPPEPRLLPNPFTDQHAEVVQYKRLHPDTARLRAGEKYPVTTPDRLPWDKRTEEIEDQDAETNGIPGKTIPVAAAMALEAGAAPGEGSPGVMPWQHDYPSRIAGTKGKSMNLDVGAKRQQGDIFDDRPRAWESLDEKFSADSTGGLDLTPKSKNPNWSR